MNSIVVRDQLIDFSVPKVMGILNLTTDSFYKESRAIAIPEVVGKVEKMVNEGMDILDLGAASSRPGANTISPEEEWSRLRPVIQVVRECFPNLPISVDTFHGKVAESAVTGGADIVNDISAFSLDDYMLDFISESKVPYILMHMKGRPATMQHNPTYENVTSEVLQFLVRKVHILRNLGLKDIIIDPGFGFGKRIEDNYELLKNLSVYKMLECPILVGLSRKSMVYKYLDITPEHALSATSALHLQALLNGGNILRVHDVKEAKEVISLLKMIKSDNP